MLLHRVGINLMIEKCLGMAEEMMGTLHEPHTAQPCVVTIYILRPVYLKIVLVPE